MSSSITRHRGVYNSNPTYWMDEYGAMKNSTGTVLDGVEVLPVLEPVIRRHTGTTFSVVVGDRTLAGPFDWESAVIALGVAREQLV